MKVDENNGPFRVSLKGFNKSDVVAYIQKLSKDYAAKEDKHKDEISRLTVDLDKYKDDVNKLSSEVRVKDAEMIEFTKNAKANSVSGEEIEALKLECAELLKTNEELKSQLDESAKMITSASGANTQAVNELTAQVAELSAEVQQKSAEIREKDEVIYRKDAEIQSKDKVIDEKNAIIEDLNDKITHNSTAQLADEQKVYESIMSKLGNIVYSAEKSAEDITAKAKSDAEDIVAHADMKKLAILEENSKISAEFGARYDFIKSEHEKIAESFVLMSEQYSAKLLELQAKLDNISKSVERNQ